MSVGSFLFLLAFTTIRSAERVHGCEGPPPRGWAWSDVIDRQNERLAAQVLTYAQEQYPEIAIHAVYSERLDPRWFGGELSKQDVYAVTRWVSGTLPRPRRVLIFNHAFSRLWSVAAALSPLQKFLVDPCLDRLAYPKASDESILISATFRRCTTELFAMKHDYERVHPLTDSTYYQKLVHHVLALRDQDQSI